MLSSLKWEFTVNINCELARNSCTHSHRSGLLLVNAMKVSLKIYTKCQNVVKFRAIIKKCMIVTTTTLFLLGS
jgi:hypothetical protein